MKLDINIEQICDLYVGKHAQKKECFNHAFCISKRIDTCMYFDVHDLYCHLHAKCARELTALPHSDLFCVLLRG